MSATALPGSPYLWGFSEAKSATGSAGIGSRYVAALTTLLAGLLLNGQRAGAVVGAVAIETAAR